MRKDSHKNIDDFVKVQVDANKGLSPKVSFIAFIGGIAVTAAMLSMLLTGCNAGVKTPSSSEPDISTSVSSVVSVPDWDSDETDATDFDVAEYNKLMNALREKYGDTTTAMEDADLLQMVEAINSLSEALNVEALDNDTAISVVSLGNVTSYEVGDNISSEQQLDQYTDMDGSLTVMSEKLQIVKSLTIDGDFSVSVGSTKHLGVIVTPTNAQYELSYKVSNTDSISVDEDGNVTGLIEGEYSIHVTDRNGVYTDIAVTVTPAEGGSSGESSVGGESSTGGESSKPTSSDSSNSDSSTGSSSTGDSSKVSTPETSKPSGGSSEVSKPISESSKPTSGSSKPSGEVSKPNSEVSKPSSEVSKPTPETSKPSEVSKPSEPVVIAVTGVSLNKTSVNLEVGDSITLKATVSPSNATNKSCTYSSSNTSVATVNSSGTVTGKGAGTCKITVKTNNGKTATCSVTVKAVEQSSSDGGRVVKPSKIPVKDAYGNTVYEAPEIAEVVNRYRAELGLSPVIWWDYATYCASCEKDFEDDPDLKEMEMRNHPDYFTPEGFYRPSYVVGITNVRNSINYMIEHQSTAHGDSHHSATIQLAAGTYENVEKWVEIVKESKAHWNQLMSPNATTIYCCYGYTDAGGIFVGIS